MTTRRARFVPRALGCALATLVSSPLLAHEPHDEYDDTPAHRDAAQDVDDSAETAATKEADTNAYVRPWSLGAGVAYTGLSGSVGAYGYGPPALGTLDIERRLTESVWLRLGVFGSYGTAQQSHTSGFMQLQTTSKSLLAGGELGPRFAFNPGDPVVVSAYVALSLMHARASSVGTWPTSTTRMTDVGARAGLAADVGITDALTLRLSTVLLAAGYLTQHSTAAAGVGGLGGLGGLAGPQAAESRGMYGSLALSPSFQLRLAF